jgi:hypothetical protein
LFDRALCSSRYAGRSRHRPDHDVGVENNQRFTSHSSKANTGSSGRS